MKRKTTRRVITFVLSAILALGMSPTIALAAGDCGCPDVQLSGSGTTADPYLVGTGAELAHIAQHLDSCVQLTGDIPLAGEWAPLGGGGQPFTGDFNGKGFKITGLQASSAEFTGLFGAVGAGANLYDFTVEGAFSAGVAVTAAGGVAGSLDGTVKNVTSGVNITIEAGAGTVYVGGVAGITTGLVRNSAYVGEITDNRVLGTGAGVGAVIGRSDVVPPEGLPTIITAHAGFGVRDSNGNPVLSATHPEAQDNTLDNFIYSTNHPLKPDALECDVRLAPDGKLRLNHEASSLSNDDLALEDVFKLLIGQHERSAELVGHGGVIKFQADVKAPLAEEVIQLARDVGFPLERLILAGDMPYSYVAQPQILATIKAAVADGMDFWMNPHFIAIEGNDGKAQTAGYMGMLNNFEGTSDSFKERINALGLPRFTVNSSYSVISPEFQARLEEAGFNLSVWTLNNSNLIDQFITRGVYNATSRLEEIVIVREGLSTGSLFNTFGGDWPEFGSDEEVPEPDGKVYVKLGGPAAAEVNDAAEYTLSVAAMEKLATATVWFEVDGEYFQGKETEALNGFETIGDITWENTGGSVWSGRVTIANMSGGVSSVGYLELLKLTLSVKEELGETAVKIKRVELSGYDEDNVAIYFDSALQKGSVATEIVPHFSPYDINRDGKVDQLDLTTAQLYYAAREGDANWNEAKIADVNGDGRVDIEDLIRILNNIEW